MFLGLLFSGSLLAFVQWLNKTKIKKQNNKKQKKNKNKMTRPNSLPLLPPFWGVQSCFFFFFFWCVVGFCAMVKQNQNPKPKKPKKQKNTKKMTRPNSLPLLPPWGVQSCFFFVVVFFLCFVFLVSWFLGVLVFWFLGFLFSGSLLVF